MSTMHPDAEVPRPLLRSIPRLWACAAVLAAVGAAVLPIDLPLARWVRAGNCPGGFQKLFQVSEVFGHGMGVAFVLLIIATLDPGRRVALVRIAAAAFGSGLAANVVKLMVARARPYSFDLQGTGLDTFHGWFPLLKTSAVQSCPSSHTATAAGLAIVLAFYYPRGRWLFPALALLAACERITDQFHFLSDTFWGAALGCLFAPLCIYGGGLSRALDRLEARLRQRGAPAVALSVEAPARVADTSRAA